MASSHVKRGRGDKGNLGDVFKENLILNMSLNLVLNLDEKLHMIHVVNLI